MTGASFLDLWRWELGRVGRSALLWIVLATLTACFVHGAIGAARLQDAQTRAQQATRAAERAHDDHLGERARAYAAPVTAAAPAVPYWQDPTNISGFSQYQVFRHAMKPPLALGALAEGIGDVAPTRLQIALNTPFGFTDTYDFENPRGLAAGRFDLCFALVYLLPIGLILLFGLLGTVERDRGMLRLIAAQGTGPRVWLGARIAAITSWSLPAVLIAIVVALAVAGAGLAAGWRELLAGLFLVAAYILFWAGLACVVLSRAPRAAAAIGMQAGLWMVLLLGVPMAGTLIGQLVDPGPSPVVAIDAERRMKDALQVERDQVIARAFSARADLRGAEDKIAALDHATRLTFLTPETEHRLAPLNIAAQAHRKRQSRWSEIAGYVSPPLGLGAGLATLAGTDQARHRRFEEQARDYQLRLRKQFYPLVQRQIVSPSPVPEPARRGRFNHDPSTPLPTFEMREISAAERVGAVIPTIAWLSALGAVLVILGLRFAGPWPREL